MDAKKRYGELQKARRLLEKDFDRYPEGKIHLLNNNGNIKYYLRTDPKDKSGKYIHKNDTETIKMFLQKRYDEQTIKLIEQEMVNLEKFIAKSDDIVSKIRNTYSNNPEEIKKYLFSIDVSDPDYAKIWEGIECKHKEIDKEDAVHITDKGEVVRSKSELHIANMLLKMGVPYKYEMQLILSNGVIVHPDFTVLNVRERKEKYWEHRGMMEDKDYAVHSLNKIKLYSKNNIFLGDRLIITEESSSVMLGTEEIKRVIKHYCL